MTLTAERHKSWLFCMQVNLFVNKSKCHVSSRVNFADWVTKAVECSCAECRWSEEVTMPVLFTAHNTCAVQTCCSCACCIKISSTLHTQTSCYNQFWQSPHFWCWMPKLQNQLDQNTSFGISNFLQVENVWGKCSALLLPVCGLSAQEQECQINYERSVCGGSVLKMLTAWTWSDYHTGV